MYAPSSGALTPNGSSPGSFGSASGSNSNLPLGQRVVQAQMRAICARRYSFSLPGKGGYARTSAPRSPVKSLPGGCEGNVLSSSGAGLRRDAGATASCQAELDRRSGVRGRAPSFQALPGRQRGAGSPPVSGRVAAPVSTSRLADPHGGRELLWLDERQLGPLARDVVGHVVHEGVAPRPVRLGRHRRRRRALLGLLGRGVL